jgi:hypothetical protein
MDSEWITYRSPAGPEKIAVQFTEDEASALIGELEGLWPGPITDKLLDELGKWV